MANIKMAARNRARVPSVTGSGLPPSDKKTRRLRRVRSARGWLACAKNQVGGAEDALRRTLIDGLALAPMLDVTPAEIRS